jgi:peptidoglycan/xylan/chitin deacetylase (PgdA/CDA1 family)
MDGGRLTRTTFARRRIALAATLLVVVACLVAVVAGASSSEPRKPARAAAPARGAARPHARRLASLLVREDRAVTDLGRRLPFVVAGGGEKREVALTFDDGPGPYTDQVLGVLHRERVPATFFVVGSMLRYFRPQLDHELQDGFVIGDHTVTHPSLRGRPLGVQLGEIGGDAGLLRSDGAALPRLFRPPYGLFDRTTLDVLRRRQMLAVLWTIDSRDYTRPGAAAIANNVLSKAKPGAIVMMHDAGGERSQTVAALPTIIRGLRRRGYRLVTVPRLLLDDPPSRRQRLPLGVRQALSHGGAGSPRA